MARLLAIEWDAKEARVAVGRARGKVLVVDQAFTVALPSRAAGEPASEAEIGAAIAGELARRGLAKSEAIVAVGRANIELRFLTTPPTPPEELPDLVRFQAMRQFTTLGEDWPLDFVPLEENRDGGLNVLAAAIAPELVSQIHATCAAAGITCAKLVLRPFAAVSLLSEKTADGRCRLLVDLLTDEADLTVLTGDKVMFPRTVRLPGMEEPEGQGRALLGEIRRTIIAAQNQLGGRRVEQIVIFGDGEHHSALRKLLEEELTLEAGVELVDPFSLVEVEGEARRQRADFPGTFAPLLGLLADEAAGRPQQMDFLHPRRRPEPPNRRRLYLLASAAGGVLALALVWLVMMQLWGLDAQISRLGQEIQAKEKAVKSGKAVRDQAAKLEQFRKGDITWLDELRLLSERAPPADKARVDELSAAVAASGGGLLTIQAVASDAEVVEEIETKLRESGRFVQGSGAKRNDKLTGLTWQFEEKIAAQSVVDQEALANQAPANKASGAAANKTTAPRAKPATAGGKP
jgi:Tfp pilus assembly PilM family ATPase